MSRTARSPVILWCAISCWLSATAFSAEPAIVVAPGVFDLEQTEGLGLQAAGGEHGYLYVAADHKYKFCHNPQQVVFRGSLFATWSNGRVDEDAVGQRTLISSSPDGVRWGTPQWLTGERHEICVAAGLHVFDDTLIAFFTVTGGTNFHPETALFAIRSRDGKEWSKRQLITKGFFIEGPRALHDGRLLLAGEQVDPDRETGRMRVLISNDPSGLGPWAEVQIEPQMAKTFGYTEPALLLTGPGKATLLLRNYSGTLYASTSNDNGSSWSVPEQTNYPDSTARIAAGTLPSGMSYLINNASATQFDRGNLVLGLSQDGVTFDRALLLRGEPTKVRYPGKHKLAGWQYPHAVSWRRHLYIAYSVNKEDVAITRIPLKRLR